MAQSSDDTLVIRDITDNITTLSVPFTIPGGLKAGGRTTIVKLLSGSLAVFSPIRLTEKVKQKIRSLGRVLFITVLNLEHHLFLSDWANEYTDAIIIGMEGLSEKRSERKDIETIKFTHVISTTNETKGVHAAFDAEFEYEFMAASRNKDVVFHHKPSATLIQADILFNLPALEQYSLVSKTDSGILTRIFNKVLTTKGSLLGQKIILWYSVAQNKEDFAKSTTIIGEWAFDRMIPCHGDVIETGARSIFRSATDWFTVKEGSPHHELTSHCLAHPFEYRNQHK
ncbi:hypothetical protein LTR84_005866 [Exophiala bonariae]|uniref:Uncharacterized protein n=1 Tax=Exophiala bonariae TaxID=1690606 RepID=A0AAV9N4F4_9EURO|nr:hypothetical protein LTR84_005866 [Exophiala bonariae]